MSSHNLKLKRVIKKSLLYPAGEKLRVQDIKKAHEVRHGEGSLLSDHCLSPQEE